MANPGKMAFKETLSPVHAHAVFCERIKKENKHQKLYTKFSINPFQPSTVCRLRKLYLKRVINKWFKNRTRLNAQQP